MAQRFLMLSTLALLPLAAAHAQVVPPAVVPPAVAPPDKMSQEWAAAQARAAADRKEMEAREEEALSKPASWAPMSLTELEQSIGGRTLVEVKAKDITLEEVATSMRAQTQLDIFTQQQILPPQQDEQLEQARNHGTLRKITYDFDISKRPLWEAVRALSIAQIAWDKAQGRDTARGFPGYSPRYSVFGDTDSLQNGLFPTPSPFVLPTLALSPVVVVRPDPPSEESLASMRPDLPADQREAMRRQMMAPLTQPASPRAAGVLWQLGPSVTNRAVDMSQGRAASSWPCLFLVDTIARRQEGNLAPDPSEAPPTPLPAAPKAEEDAKARPDAPQVLAAAEPASAPRGEWQQNVALQMRAFVDPRLHAYRNVRLVLDEASDESGHDLRREDFIKPHRVKLGEGADLNLPIALQMPIVRGDKSTKLHLRGALLFWVPARITTTEFTLDKDGTAMGQAILWGQATDMKVKLARGKDGAWMLSSTLNLNSDHGQLDFRREMGPALNEDDSYRAGLTMPGSVRVVGADGHEWKLRSWGEDQKLTLNAGVDMISRKTDYVGSFRRARTPDGTLESIIGPSEDRLRTSGSFMSPGGLIPGLRIGDKIPMAPVPPDGFAYQESVTWQLEPGGAGGAGAAGNAGGAGAAGDEPPIITKIFFDAPQEWREVRVPFEFKDLPLPPR